MRSLPLLYLVMLLVARGTTAYDSNQLVKGFLVIRNSTAARILIDQNDPLAGKSKNKKTNRNKLSLLGLGAYILSAVTVLIHGVLLLMEPLGDASYVIDTRLIHLQAGNLNEAIVLVSAFTVLLLMGGDQLSQHDRPRHSAAQGQGPKAEHWDKHHSEPFISDRSCDFWNQDDRFLEADMKRGASFPPILLQFV